MKSRIKPECAVAQDLKSLRKDVEKLRQAALKPEKAKVGQVKGRTEWSRRGVR